MGEERFTKRDGETGQFMNQKADGPEVQGRTQGELMASVEEAIALWRTRRVSVSEDCETNIEAWIVELQATLAELGLSDLDLIAYLDDNPRAWVENEYVSFLEAPSSPGGAI